MTRRHISLAVAAVALLIACIAAYVYLGLYNVAADERHWPATERLLERVRMRSILVRSRDVGEVPNLEDAKLVRKGAGQYAEMCVP